MAIARRELGSPDAPALVLLHGLGASGRALERVAPLLAARFRVIVPDLPGFGETAGEHTTIEGMARAVLEALDGELVWNRMSDHRIRATMRSAFAPGHDVGDVFVDDLKRTTRVAFTGSSAAIDDYLRRRPLPERVAALTQQAFVVFGEQDGRVDPASLDGYGPVANATVATIPEAGHTPVWEAPERTA